jgi:photosystem II stability/assembly factor-like uncharacterized protein
VDSNTVWATASDEWLLAIGGAPAGDHKITILRTVDGGQTWQSHDFSDPYETGHGGSIGRMSFDLFAFDKDTAFMTTNDYNYRSALYKTTDGGANWTLVLEDLSAGVWVRFFNRREGVLIGGIYDNFGGWRQDLGACDAACQHDVYS